jgi:hypothetical protein
VGRMTENAGNLCQCGGHAGEVRKMHVSKRSVEQNHCIILPFQTKSIFRNEEKR